MSFVWQYFEICAQDTGSRSALEVQSYMSEAQIAGSEQPTAQNKSPFPALTEVARAYCTCTSVDSEGMFSSTSNVLDEK